MRSDRLLVCIVSLNNKLITKNMILILHKPTKRPSDWYPGYIYASIAETP
jgi:hypothetical protein